MPLDDLQARRTARAAVEIADELVATGSVVRRRTDWPGSDADWTTATSAAEEHLQRPVAAGVGRTSGTVWATLLDWPRSAEELLAAARRLHELSTHPDRSSPDVPGSGTVAVCPTT